MAISKEEIDKLMEKCKEMDEVLKAQYKEAYKKGHLDGFERGYEDGYTARHYEGAN